MKREEKKSGFKLYGGRDPRELPIYGIAEAAHYLQIPVPTLRSWIKGRKYQTNSGARIFQPIIHLPEEKPPLLSFVNLVEAHILDAIRYKHKVPLANVRQAVRYLEKQSQSQHPLADNWFLTDGLDLFIEDSELDFGHL